MSKKANMRQNAIVTLSDQNKKEIDDSQTTMNALQNSHDKLNVAYEQLKSETESKVNEIEQLKFSLDEINFKYAQLEDELRKEKKKLKEISSSKHIGETAAAHGTKVTKSAAKSSKCTAAHIVANTKAIAANDDILEEEDIEFVKSISLTTTTGHHLKELQTNILAQSTVLADVSTIENDKENTSKTTKPTGVRKKSTLNRIIENISKSPIIIWLSAI